MKLADSARQKLTTGKDLFLKAKRPVQIGIIIGVLVIAGLLYTTLTKKETSTATTQTAVVEKGSVIATVSESGNVSTDNQTNISSPTDGVIQEVYVKNGDIVVAGQNLFKVKSTATEQEKATAYASYLSALNNTQSAQQSKQATQASLESARQAVLNAQSAVDSMEKNLSIGTMNPSTKQEYTQNEKDSLYSALTSAKQSFTATETKYNQADTAIGVASANQSSAWLNYQATQDTTVTAPIAGTVANFSATVGTAVTGTGSNNSSTTNSSNSDTNTATTVLVLGNFGKLNIVAPVSEVDISKIRAGQKVTITLDAFTDKTFAGQVESVDTIGTSESGVVSFNTYITFVAPSSEIQPGMTATAVIQLDRKDDVVRVPNSAVQSQNGVTYVRVMKNGEMNMVEVQTGLAADDYTEITSGIKEGDTVVTSVATVSTSTTGLTSSPFSTGNRGFGGAARSGGGQQTIMIR
jgi:macrolide-specific efflux system membrane fusion protein